MGLTSPAWVKKSIQQTESMGQTLKGYLSITLPRETASFAKTTPSSVVFVFLEEGGRTKKDNESITYHLNMVEA